MSQMWHLLFCKERLKQKRRRMTVRPLFSCGDSQANQLPLASALVSAHVVLDLWT
jgi:hypothetical protein